jgi:hypothetical protein
MTATMTARVAALALAPLLAPLLGRRWMLRWGTAGDEATRPLPGDAIVAEPAVQCTRAVTVAAPPDAIWPWLVQMGQDRAAFYSLDWLERLFGAEMHNADRVHPEWQRLAVGDPIWPYPARKLRPPDGWVVAALEPARALVVRTKDDSWSWALALAPTGAGRTRLIARTRSTRRGDFLGAALDALVLQPAHFVMELGVLRGVKRRVERAG